MTLIVFCGIEITRFFCVIAIDAYVQPNYQRRQMNHPNYTHSFSPIRGRFMWNVQECVQCFNARWLQMLTKRYSWLKSHCFGTSIPAAKLFCMGDVNTAKWLIIFFVVFHRWYSGLMQNEANVDGKQCGHHESKASHELWAEKVDWENGRQIINNKKYTRETEI